jgi:hypothetical protein
MRTSLSYAEKASGVELTRIKKALITASHIFCYIAIIGSLVFTIIFVPPGPGIIFTDIPRIIVLIIGAAFAFLYNFLNGIILKRHSNKPTMMNIALVGLFVSLYSSYFIYNAGKGPGLGIDFVDIGVTIFFLLYTMSSVGASLASRAEIDTRWKISKELAATFTFFLASGYFFLDSLLPITAGDPVFGAALGDIIKLYLFPFIALIMELFYLRKLGKPPKPVPEHEEISVIPEEQEPTEMEEEKVEKESYEAETSEDLEETSAYESDDESEEIIEYDDAEVENEEESLDENES